MSALYNIDSRVRRIIQEEMRNRHLRKDGSDGTSNCSKTALILKPSSRSKIDNKKTTTAAAVVGVYT
jgi:hypothetical protein